MIFCLLLSSSFLSASEEMTTAEKISQNIDAFFEPIVQVLDSVIFFDPFDAVGLGIEGVKIPFVVIWLIFGSLFFTIRMGFINLSGFKHAIDLVRGKYDDPNAKNDGEVSHFQALATALSATVGLGNIAGVAVAISLGGPGATFWMILAGFIGMASKFVECTLGVKYRTVDKNGIVSGGPMYYLSSALAQKGPIFGYLGKGLAVLFCILCVGGSFGGGNMFQANQAYAQLANVAPFLEGKSLYFGIFLAIAVGIVIIGGIRSIAKVTEKIVPLMCGIYIIAALAIIAVNITEFPYVIQRIITGAFSHEAVTGGAIGVLIVGFQRAAFSSEAGIGSASIAHSTAKTKEPISEGMVALLEPFIDTIVVCTLTASVIIFSGAYDVGDETVEGTSLTSAAFASVIPWFPYVLAVAISLFAFSTMISWSYYGLKAWEFLFGNSRLADLTYKMLFLIFVVIGASINLGAVVDFSDMMILGMAFPNVIGLLLLSKEIRSDLMEYWQKIKDGRIKRFK